MTRIWLIFNWSYQRFLPMIVRRRLGFWLGKRWIGAGWYIFPDGKGWAALNRDNFTGWYRYTHG